MGEWIQCKIRIGGEIPRPLVPALCAAIAEADQPLALGWGCEPFKPASEQELLGALAGGEEQGTLVLYCDQANYGDVRSLRSFLFENKIDYDWWSDAAAGEGPGISVHRARPAGAPMALTAAQVEEYYRASTDEEVVVVGVVVREAAKMLRSGNVVEALAKLDNALPPILTPIRIVDDRG